MRKLDQRTSEAHAREVLMQWNPFGTVKHIDQVRGRGTDDTPHVGERDVMRVLSFDRMYGARWNRVIPTGGQEAVRRSVDRYVEVVERQGSRRYR